MLCVTNGYTNRLQCSEASKRQGGNRLSRLGKTIGARCVLLLLLVTVLLRIVFSYALNALFSTQALMQTEIYYAATLVLGVVTMGIPVFLLIYLFRPRYVSVLKAQMEYPPFSATLRVVMAGVIGSFMLQLYSQLWAMLLEMIGVPLWVYDVPLPNNGAQIILAIAAVALMPAILEELLFRGVLLEGLKKELSRKAAIWLTALLFAFMHGSVVGLPAHLTLSFVLTLLAERQNNLQLPMVYHFTHNATMLLLSLYFRKVFEGMDASTQAAADISGPGILWAIMSLFFMAVMLTFVYWRLLKPLIMTSGTRNADLMDNDPVPLKRRNKVIVYGLIAILMAFLLFQYILNLFPA